jgi:AICAR transformylase/IMP cyclohydrolase PurH
MPTAILSVHNKSGLIEFSKGLAALGWTLLASGGTAKLLRENNVNVTYADAIENIDIGGVTLIRAAAKNHERVTLVCDPADYAEVLSLLQQGEVRFATRKRLAVKGFAATARYDAAISGYLSQ